MNEAADRLLGILRMRKHPNCTLYLIWHYVKQGEMDYAQAEFVRDSDKLGTDRQQVALILEME